MNAEFSTDAEAKAFDLFIAETEEDEVRNNRDEALCQRGWLAARDYFRGALTETGKIQATEATITHSDLHLRELALSFATQNTDGLSASSVVLKAEAFLEFLQTGASSDKPSTDLGSSS